MDFGKTGTKQQANWKYDKQGIKNHQQKNKATQLLKYLYLNYKPRFY